LIVLVGLGAAVAARAAANFLEEFGELSQEVELGYPSANALPIIGHPGFPDTSGLLHAGKLPRDGAQARFRSKIA
jgi:hypothetical protein